MLLKEKKIPSRFMEYPFDFGLTVQAGIPHNLFNFGGIAPHAGAVVRAVREGTIVQFDFIVLVLQELLNPLCQRNRLAGADIDDPVKSFLNAGSHNHAGQFIHIDKIVQVLAAGEGEGLFPSSSAWEILAKWNCRGPRHR